MEIHLDSWWFHLPQIQRTNLAKNIHICRCKFRLKVRLIFLTASSIPHCCFTEDPSGLCLPLHHFQPPLPSVSTAAIAESGSPRLPHGQVKLSRQAYSVAPNHLWFNNNFHRQKGVVMILGYRVGMMFLLKGDNGSGVTLSPCLLKRNTEYSKRHCWRTSWRTSIETISIQTITTPPASTGSLHPASTGVAIGDHRTTMIHQNLEAQ